ncbi:MAG: hypothetical protein ABSD96_17860 [Candidatus Korobacteraceae bacterium]
MPEQRILTLTEEGSKMDECKGNASNGLRWLSLLATILLLVMSASAQTKVAQDKSNEMEVQPAPGASISVPQNASNEMEVQPSTQRSKSGFIVWKGSVEKDGIIEIDGDTCTPGSIQSGLPGVPVTVNLDTKNYAMVEFPSAANGYRRMKIRSRSKKESIILNWQLAN